MRGSRSPANGNKVGWQVVRFVVADVAAGQAPTFTLDHSDAAPSENQGSQSKSWRIILHQQRGS